MFIIYVLQLVHIRGLHAKEWHSLNYFNILLFFKQDANCWHSIPYKCFELFNNPRYIAYIHTRVHENDFMNNLSQTCSLFLNKF